MLGIITRGRSLRRVVFRAKYCDKTRLELIVSHALVNIKAFGFEVKLLL